MIGLRWDVGADWGNYLRIFNHIRALDLGRAIERTEPAYALLNWAGGRAGWGIWFPNLACAAIFVMGLISLCRLQPNPWLALVIALPYFIIGVGMGYTRQSAALGFVMLAISQFLRGKMLWMCVSLALAPLFHTSAVVAVPLIGLAVASRGLGSMALLALLGGFLIVAFADQIGSRLAVYSQGSFTSGGAGPRILMNVIPAALFLANRRRLAVGQFESKLWTNFALATMMSAGLLFYVNSTTLVDRLGIYLVPLQIFVLSRIPTVFRSGSSQNMLLLVLIVAYSLAVQLIWLNLGTWGSSWLPYQNYLWK